MSFNDPVVVIGHRGAAGLVPENTLPSFRQAYACGVNAVELDVYLVESELVVIHDDTLERTTDCTGEVGEHTVAELRECDAAHWWSPGKAPTQPDEQLDHPLRGTGVTVPTLRELLAWAATLRDVPELAIEAKSIPGESNFEPVGRALAEEIVAVVEEFDLGEHVIVFSFWPSVIDHVRLLSPDLRTLVLTTSEAGILATKGLAYATLRDHDAVGPNHDAPDMDERLVETATLTGRQVYTYTVNEASDQQRVIDLGVDGVISDWPACTLRLLGRRVPGQVLPSEALANGARPMPVCPG
jgi:glycerophosphoryl diester phosphodiesterase